MLQEIVRVKRLRLRDRKIAVPLQELKAEAKDQFLYLCLYLCLYLYTATNY